jgi:hypothetical protein
MKKNQKKIFFFILITSIIGLVFFQIILSEMQNSKINNFWDLILNYNNFIYFFSLFNLSNYSIFTILKKFFFMILIFIPFTFVNFKNLKFYFIYVPIFSLYFFLDNINFLKPYFHYSTFLIPFLFFICIEEVMSSKKRILFYITINLFLTLNFFNPLFYFDNIKFTENYSFQNYKNFGNYKNLDNFLADVEIPNNEALTVSNNILHHKIINRSFLLVIDYSDDIDTSITACRNLKNRLSIFDTNKCEIRSQYALLNLKDSNNYNDVLLKDKNFEIIKKNNEFTLYRSKNFKAIFKN